MIKHPETMHEADDTDHEDCLDIARELLADLEEKQYPKHIIDIVTGIVGELEEYADDQPDNTYEAKDASDGEDADDGKDPDQEMNDDEDPLEKYAKAELAKKK